MSANPIDRHVIPPARALRLTLELDADTTKDVANALRRLAGEIDRGSVTGGAWGSPTDGARYDLLVIDPYMTHNLYHQRVREYLDSLAVEAQTKLRESK